MVNENVKSLYKKAISFLLPRTQVNESKYNSWLENCPSALASFDSLMNATTGKQIIVFLDYDGTLSPIVDNPDLAFMSDEMRSAVREVAKHFPTAIITGRSREKVYEFVKLDEIYYAGSHGMDIMGPPLHDHKSYSYDEKFKTNIIDQKGNQFTHFQPAKEYLPSILKVLKELKERTCEIEGAVVEDNGFCVSVHYRHVLEELHGILEEIVQNVLSEYKCFHVTRGIKVMEIRPSIKWNKGDALVYLLDAFRNDGSKDFVPFYLGDDTTDEDAFKVLESRKEGYPIIISSEAKETYASHSLRDPTQVLSFLHRLALWGEALAC